MRNIALSLIKLNKFLHTGIVLALDIIVSVIASAVVLLVVHLILPEFNFTSRQFTVWMLGALVWSSGVFLFGRAYRAIIRYSTLRELTRIFTVCLGKDVLMWLSMAALTDMNIGGGLIWGMVFTDFCITLSALVFLRVLMVAIYDRLVSQQRGNRKNDNRKGVLVYGISDKSISAVSRLRNSSHYHVDGFLAYGHGTSDHKLAGMNVFYFEHEADVERIKEATGVTGILFPYIDDARNEQDRLIEYCHHCNLRTYITPGIDEVTDSHSLGNYVRKVKIEDLLGRPEIKISMEEIIAEFNNKSVMVTGAAGSIGSELCRQLSTFGVRQLVLFDNAETPLHNIRLELEDRFPELNFVAVIGDVRSKARLDYVFQKYKPQIVFHAAAYKHVPLMEENPCEAVQVNVVGSRQVADKCVEYDVEKMVMVSTDKAVNPTNIMGCTKRLAEIYVQSLGLAIERGQLQGRTKFVTTRFGNVLGSNGSVIPRFREQIEHGGPVTVTHPDINRFFMTIPEACRLVMEAATFATGTQIFVFDMGEPVKIVTLAERMISLAGLTLGRDIQIEFTGLRPGEKLYEEVLATKENTIPTQHERIFVAKAREYPHNDAISVAEKLEKLSADVIIPDMVKLMKLTVPEFKSKNSEYEKFDTENA